MQINLRNSLRQKEMSMKPFQKKPEKRCLKFIQNQKKFQTKIFSQKKNLIEKEIEEEVLKAQKEILVIKKNSISSIQKISENIASNIIESISGEKLNESSIKAVVEDISKKNIGKYL